MDAPTPLPTTAGISRGFWEGGGMASIPPDRFTDYAAPTAICYVIIRWQDDKSGRWSKEKQISLGTSGQTNLTRYYGPMGIYRSRQYEIICSDPVKFILAGLEEDLGVLI